MKIHKIATAVAVATLATQAAQAAYTINDLYLGCNGAGANSDYIIDLGNAASDVGVGGSSVVNLSSHFSLSSFNSVFSGPEGVTLAVVGGNKNFGSYDLYVTQVRSGGAGNSPATPGSDLSSTYHSQGFLSQAAVVLSSGVDVLPAAGSDTVDSTQWYTANIGPDPAAPFYSKSTVDAFGTIDASSVIYLDLWYATVASAYSYQGYFTLDLSGSTPSLTFTPKAAVIGSSAPVAGFTATPTNGFAPLQVVFTDTSTGSVTNWQWTFGDGQGITNSTSASVTNTYAAVGNYTVTLVATGPGGASTNTQSSLITTLPIPSLSSPKLSGGNLVFSGSNCPPGVQYRILSSTNVASPLSSWVPSATASFQSDGTFSCTNSATNRASFFKLVSP